MKKDPEDVGVQLLHPHSNNLQIPRKGRYELYNSITMDYYGFRDEDDGTLLIEEAAAEARAVEEAVQEWEEREAMKKSMISGFGSL